MAIAPPFTFNISSFISPRGSELNSFLQKLFDLKASRFAITCAAKASFSSIKSIFFRLTPVLSNSFLWQRLDLSPFYWHQDQHKHNLL